MGPVNDSIPGPKGKAERRSAAVVLTAVKSHLFPRMNRSCTDESKALLFNRSIHEAETPMADPCSISSSSPLNSQCFTLFHGNVPPPLHCHSGFCACLSQSGGARHLRYSI